MTVEQRSLTAPAGAEDRLLFEETAHDVLPPAEAADIVARSKRMRVVLERGTQPCPASRTRGRPTHSKEATHG